MIKRRFYKLEHGDRDAPSESSSSSSDSELEKEATDDSEEEEDANAEVIKKDESGSASSGYESEDSSAHEVSLDSSGLPTSDEDVGPQRQSFSENQSFGQSTIDSVDLQPNAVAEKDEKDRLDVPDCVVKHKAVFKCKLCPRIVCLSEETLNGHLKSKRHARSEKLLKEGRLKLILDTDCKLEEEAAPTVGKLEEEAAPTVALAQNSGKSRRKKRARRGQNKRKKTERLSFDDARQSTKNQAKKRHKGDN